MIIDNQKHYVSIPKTEFEKMEAIVNDKKDINVTFRLSLYTNNYGNYEQIFYCHNLTYELNERIDWEKINDTSKLIQSACEKVLEEKNKDISVLNYELSEIKSKWWYKLFSWQYCAVLFKSKIENMKSNNKKKMPKAGQAGNGTKPHVVRCNQEL